LMIRPNLSPRAMTLLGRPGETRTAKSASIW